MFSPYYNTKECVCVCVCVCVCACVCVCVLVSIWSGADFRETGRLVPSPRCHCGAHLRPGTPRHQSRLSGSWLAQSVTPGNNHCLTPRVAATGFIETEWGTPCAASDHQHSVCVCVCVCVLLLSLLQPSHKLTHMDVLANGHTDKVKYSKTSDLSLFTGVKGQIHPKMKIQSSTFHQHCGEKIITELSFLRELYL